MEACCLLAVVAVPLVVAPWLTVPFSLPKTHLLEILVGLSVVLAAVCWWRRGRAGGPYSLSALVWVSVFAYASVLLLSTATSINPEVSFWSAYPDQPGISTLQQLSFLAFFLVVGLALRRPAQRERLVLALALAGGAVSAVGVVQYGWTDPLGFMGPRDDRIIATLGNAVYVGAFLVSTVPFVAVLAARHVSEAFGVGPRRRALAKAVALVTLLALQLATVVISLSRGSMIGLAAGLFVLVVVVARCFSRQQFLSLAMVLVVAVAAATLLIQVLPHRQPEGALATTAWRFGYANPVGDLTQSAALEATSSPDPSSLALFTSGRSLIWQAALGLVTSRPWVDFAPGLPVAVRHLLGYGPETTRVVNRLVYTDELRAFEPTGRFFNEHNLLLQIVLELGWAGLLAFALLLSACLVQAWRSMRGSSGQGAAAGWLPAAAAAAIVGHVAEQMTGVPFAGADVAFWAALALAAGGTQVASSWVPPRLPRTMLVLSATAGVALVIVGVNALLAEGRASAGVRALGDGDLAVAERSLKAALEIAPSPAYYQVMLGVIYGRTAVEMDEPRRTEVLRISARYLDEALRQDPWSMVARSARAWVGSILGVTDSAERGRTRRAYSELRVLTPGEQDSVLAWAYALVLWSEPQAALDVLQAPTSGLTSYKAEVYRAMALDDLGQKDQALAAVERALARAPAEERTSIQALRSQLLSGS